jgi:ribosomal protein S18 acetylase RimI-like enzyme
MQTFVLRVRCVGHDPRFVYRDMKEGDEGEMSALVRRLFGKYIAHTYAPEGLAEFMKGAQPSALLDRMKQGQIVILAVSQEDIAGVIAVRDGNHISLLFVDERFHRKGIAQALVSMARERARAADPSIRDFTVNSSPYAVKFYEKLGFCATGPERMMRGMRITPMRSFL